MRRLIALLCLVPAGAGAADADPGPFVRALWLVQRHGTPSAGDPANDVRVKAVLSKALGKDGALTHAKLGGLMADDTFQKLAGNDDRIDANEIRQAVDAASPESRQRLLAPVRAYADQLTTSLDMIDPPHQAAGRELATWIADNYRPGRGLDVIVVCTGNSRRSILGATLGNIAAAYYGMPDIRFHSGGTAPSAFNARSVKALKAIGVEVEPTGKEAARGAEKTANPIYRVRWGTPAESAAPLETVEFSKHYGDPSNPQKGFAALMVCSEADAACPAVKGAALRVSMPYLDPKIYDGSAYETAKYAERRDDIGRVMLSAMLQARQRIEAGGSR